MVHTACLVVNVSSVSRISTNIGLIVGTSIDLAHLPCQPTCLVSPLALSAHLPSQPTCLVSPPALNVPPTSTHVELHDLAYSYALSSPLLLYIYDLTSPCCLYENTVISMIFLNNYLGQCCGA